VPLLGSIPLFGQLFKTRNATKRKNELMVFIHPTVLDNGEEVAVETNAKYLSLRHEQATYKNGKVTLLSSEKQPALPPLEEKTKFVDPSTAPKDEPAVHDDNVIDARSKRAPITIQPSQPPGDPAHAPTQPTESPPKP
jgi:general secretion pathway protein D